MENVLELECGNLRGEAGHQTNHVPARSLVIKSRGALLVSHTYQGFNVAVSVLLAPPFLMP